MWQRFNIEAKSCVYRAQAIAKEAGGEVVGSEHLLIALATMPRSQGYLALESLHVDMLMFRADVARRLDPHLSKGKPKVVLNASGKQAIKLAYDCARAWGHTNIGTTHLLAGISRLDTGVTADVLQKHKITEIDVERAVKLMEPGDESRNMQVYFKWKPDVIIEATFSRAPYGAQIVSLFIGLMSDLDGISVELCKRAGCELVSFGKSLERGGTSEEASRLGVPDVLFVQILDRAIEEASILRRTIGPEHFFLALLTFTSHPVIIEFAKQGLTLEKARQVLHDIYEEPTS